MNLEREWTISDVAKMMGVSYKVAKTALLRLNEEVGGMLLRPSKGVNRQYTIRPAALKRACPDWFETTMNLEARVDAIEDLQKEEVARTNTIARTVGIDRKSVV